MTETHKRTLVKIILYRITTVTITALWIGLSKAIAIHAILIVWHYGYERVWLKIKWGKNYVE